GVGGGGKVGERQGWATHGTRAVLVGNPAARAVACSVAAAAVGLVACHYAIADGKVCAVQTGRRRVFQVFNGAAQGHASRAAGARRSAHGPVVRTPAVADEKGGVA